MTPTGTASSVSVVAVAGDGHAPVGVSGLCGGRVPERERRGNARDADGVDGHCAVAHDAPLWLEADDVRSGVDVQ
jgi:hypothetical protein